MSYLSLSRLNYLQNLNSFLLMIHFRILHAFHSLCLRIVLLYRRLLALAFTSLCLEFEHRHVICWQLASSRTSEVNLQRSRQLAPEFSIFEPILPSTHYQSSQTRSDQLRFLQNLKGYLVDQSVPTSCCQNLPRYWLVLLTSTNLFHQLLYITS